MGHQREFAAQGGRILPQPHRPTARETQGAWERGELQFAASNLAFPEGRTRDETEIDPETLRGVIHEDNRSEELKLPLLQDLGHGILSPGFLPCLRMLRGSEARFNLLTGWICEYQYLPQEKSGAVKEKK